MLRKQNIRLIYILTEK